MTIKQDFSDQRSSINYLQCLSDNTKAEIFSWVAVSNISMLYLELLIMGAFLEAWFDVLNEMVEMIVQFFHLLEVNYTKETEVMAANWWFLVKVCYFFKQ